ncbi:MAG: tetratricopeptide repeat protein, partial [Cyanobacteria bacterium]|nr:tetratricopeptide repeat protein [Cyanobacteriota bacterium]
TILMAYINQWRWSDALKAALAEEKISKQFKLPPETLQRLNTHFATIYLDMGNIVKAKAYIKQALKQLSNLPSQSQNSGWLWDTYNTAALVEHADQEDEEAIKHYEMAIRIAREAKDSYRLADSLVKLARLYEDRDSHLKAASFQEQAIVVYTGKKILKSNTTMLAYLTLAEYYRAENDFSKSLQCIQKAEQLAKLVEPRDEKAATFSSMEDKANAQKHINAAINMIPQDVGKNNHQAHQLVDIYMNAAKIEDHFGNIDAALKRLRLGLELAKQQNILPKIGEIHWALARLLHRQGQTAESIRLLEDNIAIYTQLTGPESKEVKATVTALDMVRNGKNF